MNKNIAYGGMGTSLAVLMLALSAYLPTGKAATLFLASLTLYVISLYTNVKTAIIVYVASSVLSVLIAPGGIGGNIISFIICFGNYPVIKTTLDKLKLPISILFKFILYTVYYAVVYLVFTFVFNISIPYAVWMLYLGGIFVFAFYDYLLHSTGLYVMNILFKRF